MAFGFNPFTGNFDLTGGGDAAPFAGQVDAYADLPLDSAAALNSRWLVKNNSGTWPFSNYKQAGIYIRVSTAGASRDTDYQFVGTLPSVMNDSEFLVYDDTDATKNLKFQLSGIAPGTTRTITMPNANVTLPNQGTSTTDSPTFQKITISGDEINGTAGAIHYRVSSEDPIGNQAIPYFAVESYDQDTENRVGFALLGVRADKAFIQGESADFRIEQSGGGLANIKARKLVLEDATTAGDPTATFDADGNLTANQTYDLPNASGTLALTAQLTDTQIFTANGTWTKPAGAKMVHYIVIGGGGGGGSGRCDNAGTDRSGGGGGCAGGITVGWLDASALGATETITVGAGGAGGAARTTVANGQLGTSGGVSSIGSVIQTFASGGGSGGTTTTGAGGSGASNSARIYSADGTTNGGVNGSNGSRTQGSAVFNAPTGGQGGSGISAANAVSASAAAADSGHVRTGALVAGGTGGASAAGGNGNSGGMNFVGTGGGGGSPNSSTGAGNAGGNGGLYGGGGGGGSAGALPAASGAGGNGAAGIVVITTYF
jgi:hypothetical protein